MEALQEAMDPEAEVETPSTSESGGIGVLVIEDEEREDEGGKLFMQFSEGNQDAFAQLIELYQPRMFRKILAMVRDFQIAEDLMQEIWIKLTQDISYDDSQPFHPWLSRIVTNHVLDYFRLLSTRKSKRTRVFSAFEDDKDAVLPIPIAPKDMTLSSVLQCELREELEKALIQISDVEQETLRLRYLNGLSLDEVASIQGITPHAVVVRTTDARKHIRHKLVLMMY